MFSLRAAPLFYENEFSLAEVRITAGHLLILPTARRHRAFRVCLRLVRCSLLLGDRTTSGDLSYSIISYLSALRVEGLIFSVSW